MKKNDFAKLATLPLVPFITMLCAQQKALGVNIQQKGVSAKNLKAESKTASESVYESVVSHLKEKGYNIKDSLMIADSCY